MGGGGVIEEVGGGYSGCGWWSGWVMGWELEEGWMVGRGGGVY